MNDKTYKIIKVISIVSVLGILILCMFAMAPWQLVLAILFFPALIALASIN